MVDAIQLRTAEERGIKQGVKQLLVRQLAKRFGTVSASLAERLSHMSTGTLIELGVDMLDFQSLSEVEQWIDRRSA